MNDAIYVMDLPLLGLTRMTRMTRLFSICGSIGMDSDIPYHL